MHDDDQDFRFEPGQRGSSQFAAVLLALVAIAAILLVNSTLLAPPAAASAHAAPSPSGLSSAPTCEDKAPLAALRS